MRLRATLAFLATATAALALALLGAGCGSSASSALDPVAQAAETTSHAGGARISLNIDMNLGGSVGAFSMSGRGSLNFKSREGQIDLSITGLPTGPMAMTELFAGDAVYVESGLLAGKLPGGARWLKVDLSKAAKNIGVDPQSLTSGESNPGQYLDYLKAAGGDVKVAGTAMVRGAKTTRYTGTVDLRKAADLLPGKDRAAGRGAIEKLIAQVGRSSLPIEVWVDEAHRVRKMSMTLELSVSGQRVHAEIGMELFDFGPTPAVHPPAAGEVYEPSLGSLTSGG
jgi:hypothetical protein